jgi:bacterial/archaeal transporter family-2 protein
MQWVLYVFAAAAGAMNAIQPGCNSTLGRTLDQPFVAALTVLAVSFTSILTLGLLLGQLAWPGGTKIAEVPWWAWIGGMLGANYLMSMLFVAQRVGAAMFMGLTVTVAILTSLMLDHFGWVGFHQHSINWGRALGCLLMISGLGLIAKF